jgi:hypothetical protein
MADITGNTVYIPTEMKRKPLRGEENNDNTQNKDRNIYYSSVRVSISRNLDNSDLNVQVRAKRQRITEE